MRDECLNCSAYGLHTRPGWGDRFQQFTGCGTVRNGERSVPHTEYLHQGSRQHYATRVNAAGEYQGKLLTEGELPEAVFRVENGDTDQRHTSKGNVVEWPEIELCLDSPGSAQKLRRIISYGNPFEYLGGMRNRTLRKEIWRQPEFMALTAEERLMFLGLHNMADDAGRLKYDPQGILMALFAADPDINVVVTLEALVKSGIVHYYEAGRKPYLLLPDFEKKQVC
jgi:hypothetical protein